MKNIKDFREYLLYLNLAISFQDEIRRNLIIKECLNSLEQARELGEMADRTYYRCKKEFNRLVENMKYFEANK